MDIGLYIRLFGRPGGPAPAPTWASIRDQACAAEAAGFDRVVLEDALMYVDEAGAIGVWESVSMAAALAAATSTIGIGHAVINNPYRQPALMAKVAETLDEISGGRYTFGIGLGNTPDDYEPFGIAADRRYSRFAESIRIIRALLRDGRADFQGTFYQADGAELVLRGPRSHGPPIVIAGMKPKMLRLAAEYGDEWNWWTTEQDGRATLRPILDELDSACREVGRDPATLRRSLDVFSVAAPGGEGSVSGSPGEVADRLLAYGELGFDEVRVDLRVARGASPLPGIEWMAEVVARLHA